MSDDDRMFERRARAWLELGPVDAPERPVEAALLNIESATQERDLRIPWRFPTMTTRLRLAAVAVFGVLAVGLIYLNRPGIGDVGSPSQSPSNAPPTATPAASAFNPPTDLHGWIVFEFAGKEGPDGSTSAGADTHSIWLVHADGSNLHELAPGIPAAGKFSFDISGDGKKVAFGTSDLPAQLWEVGIEGADPRLLSTQCSGLEAECLEGAPAYSPTGLSLAFVRGRAGGPDVLGVRDLVTEEVTLLETTRTSSPDIGLSEPSWSPDGTQIVYGELHFDPAQDNKIIDARLFIVNADGSGRHELAVPEGTPVGDADWSPDGSRIAFGSYPIHEYGSQQAEVYSVKPDGTDLQQLGHLGVGSGAPSWTSDGAHIVYWGFQSFYVMDPDGGNAGPINRAALAFNVDGYGFYAQLQPTP